MLLFSRCLLHCAVECRVIDPGIVISTVLLTISKNNVVVFGNVELEVSDSISDAKYLGFNY